MQSGHFVYRNLSEGKGVSMAMLSSHTGPNGLQAANYLTDCLKDELGIKMYRFKPEHLRSG